jgi:hypothetical protein
MLPRADDKQIGQRIGNKKASKREQRKRKKNKKEERKIKKYKFTPFTTRGLMTFEEKEYIA